MKSRVDGRRILDSAVTTVMLCLTFRFGRIDAPRWAVPAVTWLTDGADPGTLEAVLRDCDAVPRDCAAPPDDEANDTGGARLRAGHVLVGGSFELSAAVSDAWAQGAGIDWVHYYEDEPRGRVPLPAYPFTRRRYWHDRVGRRPRAGDAHEPSRTGSGVDVLRAVEAVWREILGVETIDLDAHFIDDLSGDSMYAVEIGAALSDLFQVDIPLDLPFVAPTLTAAAEYVEKVLHGQGAEGADSSDSDSSDAPQAGRS